MSNRAFQIYAFGQKYSDFSLNSVSKGLLGIEEDNKTYKNYANLKQLLIRQLKEIVKKTDLKDVKLQESKEMSKQKIFKIIINNKKTKEISKEKPSKELLENILKDMTKPMQF